ncbi:MAG: hypothetical protein RLZZ136_554 [Pseudomonadota bacterium]
MARQSGLNLPISIKRFGCSYAFSLMYLVRSRRLELPRAFAHNDLNVARLPVPPRPLNQRGGISRPGGVGARH